MNKTDFVREITRNTESNYTQKEVTEILDTAKEVLVNALVKGEKVSFVGFGSFEAKERSEREARNPQTGETMTVKACKTPKFKAGKALKEAINKA